MIAVANSGPLIVLAKVNHLYLLSSLYEEVIIPHAVYHEAVVVGRARGYPDAEMLQAFLNKKGWEPIEPAGMPPELRGDIRLGRGEREAIALAREYQCLLLIDEVEARSVAERMGLQPLGSLGILVEAYREDLLTSRMLEELLILMEKREDIWIHPDLCRRLRLEVLGE